ncbi:hypothetical protein K470DRAFT_261138 [Piedraia hortae CBS 480.64]|uniref:Uncharacterized protein n=1 Tax=Piedraia hortae CBS 480.64 TaxID=1314780 RepID=A0A6A7BRE8_9PEZI|nr:hypothetical protein K470DRAFT_261138 [Piedraia hortae CBS 480.64]
MYTGWSFALVRELLTQTSAARHPAFGGPCPHSEYNGLCTSLALLRARKNEKVQMQDFWIRMEANSRDPYPEGTVWRVGRHEWFC